LVCDTKLFNRRVFVIYNIYIGIRKKINSVTNIIIIRQQKKKEKDKPKLLVTETTQVTPMPIVSQYNSIALLDL